VTGGFIIGKLLVASSKPTVPPQRTSASKDWAIEAPALMRRPSEARPKGGYAVRDIQNQKARPLGPRFEIVL